MRTPTARPAILTALLLGCLLFAPTLHAQPKDRAKIAKTATDFTAYHAGQKGTAVVVLDVPAGFHAQSRTPLDENLIKFQVKLDKSETVTFGEVAYPPGHIEEYKDLGKLSVYTGKVVLRIPFEVKADAAAGDLKISGSLFYQLCDDKACYPPEKPKFTIETKVVPASEETKPNEADADLFKKPETSGAATPAPAVSPAPVVAPAAGAKENERATIAKAVVDSTAYRPGQKGRAAVVLDVRAGFHAQSRTPLDESAFKFDVKLGKNDAVTFGDVVYPAGTIEEYPLLGKLSVYTGKVVLLIPFEVKPDAAPGELKLTGSLAYQLCDDSVCYQPEFPKFTIATKVAAPGEAVLANEAEAELFKSLGPELPARASATATAGAVTPLLPAPVSAPSLKLEGSEWTAGYAFLAAFIAGLIFNIMPCVLPVLPIKAVGFYEAGQHSRARSFGLGVVFSLGVISVFLALGILVLVMKQFTWGGLFSKGWFVWTIVILLIGFAMSMFGLFEFRLPGVAYNYQPRHDTISGNYLLGGFTAILATPCTAPLLPPLLIWAALQPTKLIGVLALVMVGVGMATPYLILSALPEVAKRFPRTGPWSELFKQMMGFMLLAAAAYFAGGRLIHGPNFFWLVVAVVAVASLYLMARSVQLTKNAGPVGVCAVIAVVMLGGALWWTAKVTGLGASGDAVAAGTPNSRGGPLASATWVPYSNEQFDAARASGKTVLVKFTANWCATCQVIEGTVFRDPAVWGSLASHDVVTMKVDLTNDGAPGNDLLLKLNPAGGIPLTAIFSGRSPDPVVLASVYTSADLLAAIDRAAGTPQIAAK